MKLLKLSQRSISCPQDTLHPMTSLSASFFPVSAHFFVHSLLCPFQAPESKLTLAVLGGTWGLTLATSWPDLFQHPQLLPLCPSWQTGRLAVCFWLNAHVQLESCQGMGHFDISCHSGRLLDQLSCVRHLWGCGLAGMVSKTGVSLSYPASMLVWYQHTLVPLRLLTPSSGLSCAFL